MKPSILLAALSTCALFFTACSEKPKLDEANDNLNAAVNHVDAIAASQLLSSKPDIVVLDVRTPEEYAAGHLPGTVVNVDYRDAGFKAAAAELDREKSYLVHCQGGGRSSESLTALQELGFKHLYHLDGGLTAWTESGETLTK